MLVIKAHTRTGEWSNQKVRTAVNPSTKDGRVRRFPTAHCAGNLHVDQYHVGQAGKDHLKEFEV